MSLDVDVESEIAVGHMLLVEEGLLEQRLEECNPVHIGPIIGYERNGDNLAYCVHCYGDVSSSYLKCDKMHDL